MKKNAAIAAILTLILSLGSFGKEARMPSNAKLSR